MILAAARIATTLHDCHAECRLSGSYLGEGNIGQTNVQDNFR